MGQSPVDGDGEFVVVRRPGTIFIEARISQDVSDIQEVSIEASDLFCYVS
jgi:hypothetical protein